MLVLVDDGKLDVLADQGRFLWRRRLEGDAGPGGETRGRIARNAFVDLNLAGLDQRLEPGARERDTSCRRRLPEEPIEPLSGILRADVEDLRPLGRNEWSEGLGGNRDGFRLDLIALGRATPGTLLRLGVHARASRRRGRVAPVSRRGRRHKGTERRDDRFYVRPRAGLTGVKPAPHRRHMGGVLPQQPPTMRAPQSTASPGVSLMSSGVPE